MAFSWANQKIKTKKHMLQRMKQLANHNPDFAIKHPELVKELLNKSLSNKPETIKYINKKVGKSFKYGETPKPSVVIKRYNRNV